MKHPPQPVKLRCCNTTVMVTGRASKLAERGRNHRCPTCGKHYIVVGQHYTPVAIS